MQCNAIFFIVVKVLCVSGCFSAHHHELKNCTYSIPDAVYTVFELVFFTNTRCCMYSFWAGICYKYPMLYVQFLSWYFLQIPDAVCTVFELVFVTNTRCCMYSFLSWYLLQIPDAVCTVFELVFVTNTRCCMYSFWIPDDRQGNHLKHAELWQQ